ncbi:MAG: SufB/SufD family protein [Oscillospiraceae bacterium]
MKTTLQNLNALPMPTWRWLGVNHTSLEEEVPEILPLQNFKAPALPAGVFPLEELPSLLETLPTGCGQNAAEFVQSWQNAAFALRAEKNAQAAQPLVYRYNLSETAPSVVDDTLLLAEENSSLTVVQVFSSADEALHLHAGLTRIAAKRGAQVKLVQVQMLNAASVSLCNVGVYAEEGASVELIQLELGAKRAVSGGHTVLAGRGADMQIETLYLGSGVRTLDFNYVVQHLAPETTSNMQAAGALFDESQKIYRGTIDFVSGAARSAGHQHENTLLFSQSARNRTTPLILCGEENVEGQHAATIGKVDAAKQFYLQARGLTEPQIKRLMVDAQFAPTLAKLPVPGLQEEIAQYLEERMGQI